jgi:hypothetical protein
VWFEESAHFPFFEQPDLFHREMRRVAREVAGFWKEKDSGALLHSGPRQTGRRSGRGFATPLIAGTLDGGALTELLALDSKE